MHQLKNETIKKLKDIIFDLQTYLFILKTVKDSLIKILLVEDDPLMSAALAKMLSENDYAIALAADGQTGLEQSMAVEYDLIVLDLQIPKLDGIRLCRQLRSQGYQKPILLLSAKNSNTEIVAGLDAGADDYVIKPLIPEQFLARIRALLRRSGAIGTENTDPACRLTWGGLCLDFSAGRVSFDNQVIPLTATEYNLLELFLRNRDRIFSRSAILDRLWGFDDAPTERAIVTHVKDLRKKLKAAGLTEEIIETVYGMGYRLKPHPKASRLGSKTGTSLIHSTAIAKLRTEDLAALNKVMERFRNSFEQQVEVLAQARTSLQAGSFEAPLRQAAQQEAHKLAGSMGSFGYPEGSKLARSVEHLLSDDHPLSPQEVSYFGELVSALEAEIRKPPIPLTFTPVTKVPNYDVLVIDDDARLTAQLQAQGKAWGLDLQIAPDLTSARSRMALAPPDVVLLDLSFPATKEDGLTLLRELTQKWPHLPVIIFTGRDSLADRLAVSRLGARQFLHKPATTEQIFQAIARVLSHTQTSEARVLIVDDDSTLLASLSALLMPWGLEVITLTEPEKFWEVLSATSPDLVLLDLEMPVLSGLDLCQVIRQDAQWGDLPILVVTAHTDAEALQQAFAAGADDFITKPVLGPELVTRVLSRIERRRSHLKPRFVSHNPKERE